MFFNCNVTYYQGNHPICWRKENFLCSNKLAVISAKIYFKARLEPMKTHVLYLVSDRAKALIKLAETGLKCPSIPDLFHLLHELVKGYSLGIWRQLKTARQGLS